MDEETNKIIDEQIKKLPKDVLSAITAVDYKTKLQEITKRQKLLIDQAGKLELETTLVMIGLEPLTDFISNLQSELGLPIVKAKEVALDVSETIFKPIRESLRAMNEAAEQEESVGQTETEPPAPKFTDSNEQNLNRDQILSEIENPIPIRTNKTNPDNTPLVEKTIEIRPKQEIETLAELPYQQDIKPVGNKPNSTTPKSDFQLVGYETPKSINETEAESASSASLLAAKMTDVTLTKRKIVDVPSEIKLPETEKKKPSSGVDPYREPII